MAVSNQNSTTPEAEKDLAQTPPWFIKSLEAYLGKKFDIDVCALAATAKADIYYSLEDGNDALICNWVEDYQECVESEDFPLGYCNPPFSYMLPWLTKVIAQVNNGVTMAMMIPNNPETAYVRMAKQYAERIIEMPFRLKFYRPDGTKFLDDKGREKSPKFGCMIALFTEEGLVCDTKHCYHDFRVGFYK